MGRDLLAEAGRGRIREASEHRRFKPGILQSVIPDLRENGLFKSVVIESSDLSAFAQVRANR